MCPASRRRVRAVDCSARGRRARDDRGWALSRFPAGPRSASGRHADAVFVTGTFDDWAGDRIALGRDSDGTTGTWSADVEGVEPGAEYRYTIRTAAGDLSRTTRTRAR